MIRYISMCIGVLLLAAGLAGSASAGRGVTLIGRPAPELLVEKWDLPGSAAVPRMSHLKGKVVALLLFQATCQACHRSGFPLFQAIEKQLGGDPGLVTLYVQTPFEALMFNGFPQGQASVKQYGVKGSFAQDRTMPGSVVPATFSRFRADGTPWVVFVDRAGMVRFAGYPELERGMIDQLRKLLAEPAPAASPGP